jgi:hypothetical protein
MFVHETSETHRGSSACTRILASSRAPSVDDQAAAGVKGGWRDSDRRSALAAPFENLSRKTSAGLQASSEAKIN